MLPAVAAINVPANPQAISGAWEQPIASGKVVGIDIQIRTARRHVDYVWITTYERRWGRSERTTWSSELPGEFSWTNNRLQLRASKTWGEVQAVALDVTFDPKSSVWRGSMKNGWYEGNVALKRPYAAHIGYKIIGDWIVGEPAGGSYGCKHIALGADSTLVIWSDEIDQHAANQWYGDMDLDPEEKDIATNMLFFTGTDMSGDVVIGNVDQKGDTFVGEAAHFGNGLSNGKFNPTTWKRTTPDCRTAGG